MDWMQEVMIYEWVGVEGRAEIYGDAPLEPLCGKYGRKEIKVFFKIKSTSFDPFVIMYS